MNNDNEITIYQSDQPMKNTSGQKIWNYSLKGNGRFGNVIRTGWVESKNLTDHQKQIIKNLLEDSNIRSVYRRGNKFYAAPEQGDEKQILTCPE